MEPLCALAYFAIILGVGGAVTRTLPLEAELQFIASLVVGSCVLGMVFVGLACAGGVTPGLVFGVVAIGLLAALINARFLATITAAFFRNLYHYLFSEKKFLTLFSVGFAILLLWYILLAWGPPRYLDAMKYHLAQLDDIARHHSLVFRPYVHYNFPLFFSILFLPVYLASGGVGMQMAHLGYFLLTAALVLYIACRYRLGYPRLLLILIFLTPVSFHEATQVFNDWAALFYLMAAFAFLSRSSPEEPVSTVRLVLAFLAWGFALGIKYHGILFAPWLLVLTWDRTKAQSLPKRIFMIGGLLSLAGLMVSPFLLRNFINTGNPVFPLMAGIFPGKDTYFNLIAREFIKGLSGSHTPASLWISLKNLAFSPVILATLWLLGGMGWLVDHKTDLRLILGPFLFLAAWWLLQPYLYPRFAIFLLPFAWLAVLILWEWTLRAGRPLLRAAVIGLVTITLAYGLALGSLYSQDYTVYYLGRDEARFHQATWFWQDYQWLNANLPKQARVLVLVSSGQTYYLKRDYLRGDPSLSGLIDWRKINTPKELLQRLTALGIDYIFYEHRSWRGCPGGEKVNRLLMELPVYGGAEVVWTRPTELSISRIFKRFQTTKVTLLKVKAPSPFNHPS